MTRLDWAGSDLLSAADFKKQATLKVGDHDSPTALRESLKSLTDAYGARGYIDANILAPPAVDHVALQPGDVYDSTYLQRFVTQNNTPMKQGYNMSIAMKRDPTALTVDLAVTFYKGTAPRQ